MKFFNCSLTEISERFGKKKIIFFGAGNWIGQVEYTEMDTVKEQFSYVIDNSPGHKILLSGKLLEVFKPDKLKEESECIVILTSPIYQYDMYCQLMQMGLNDGIECCSFPFMQLITPDVIDDELLKRVKNNTLHKIPKIIHGFWFSGDPKSDLYKRCVDSWHGILTDYEIIEWNKDNYDWHKNPFLEKAIECKAWAFASDYARLDVLNEYGGIYLDMDIEVFKPFDDLLGNDAIFSFYNHASIDLAMMGSCPNNEIIGKLLSIYDDVEIPLNKDGFSRFHQPKIIRRTLAESGIRLNGSLQILNGIATVFPKEFFMPLDPVLFTGFEKTEHTYCVHYDNFGWSDSDSRAKKILDNRKLWELIET